MRLMQASPPSSPMALTVLALLQYKPMHPYGMQRLIKQWGKDQVVNVGQRATLYRTIERLHEAGLVTVRETTRSPAYPERTVYEITDAGRDVAREWLEEMLAVPKAEFPQFPAALSHLVMLSPAQIIAALQRRLETLTVRLAGINADLRRENRRGLPRVTMLESEYLRTVTAAEVRWLRSVINDLQSSRLTWDPAELIAISESHEPALDG
jgi:DNA-binding PadR family transcriptional regulator